VIEENIYIIIRYFHWNVKINNKWRSDIKKKNKLIFQKLYATEEYAARSRDIFIMENLKNDHYKLNFKWTSTEINKWNTLLKGYITTAKKMLHQNILVLVMINLKVNGK